MLDYFLKFYPLLIVLIPFYMSYMARASGGGLFAPKVWGRLPEILFTLPLAVAGAYVYGPFLSDILSSYSHLTPFTLEPFSLAGIISFLVSYFAMEMGHGTIYRMGGWDSSNPNRKQTIEYVVRPIYKLFSKDIKKPAYSWACMGFKGLLIGLPLGLLAPLVAILWPLAYYVGARLDHATEIGEYVSGMSAGTATAICLIILFVL